MESLLAKTKRIKKQKQKKLLIIFSLLISFTFGTTVLASSDEIKEGLNDFANGITDHLIREAENKLSLEGSNYVNAILENVDISKKTISKELMLFEQTELERASEELKLYYEKKLEEINNATKAEIESGKELIKEQINSSIAKEKEDIEIQLKEKQQTILTESTIKPTETVVPIESLQPVEFEPSNEPTENDPLNPISEDPK